MSSTGRREKEENIAPREARAENMVDLATCTQSNACGSCNGWNLLTIPVSFSKVSLKKNWNLLIIPVSFFSKDSIIPWNLLAFFSSNGGNFPVALLE